MRSTLKEKLPEKSIAIVAHRYHPGGIDDHFVRFLNSFPTGHVLQIYHPFSYAHPIESRSIEYKDGQKIKDETAPHFRGPDLLFYFKDVIFTLIFVFRSKIYFDLFVGMDNLNAIAGYFLKILGRVKYVVFYTIDYVPQRFKNQFLNRLYHRIDRFCCSFCDEVWNLSPAMEVARRENGFNPRKPALQRVVPLGPQVDKILPPPIEKINRHTIVFLGHLIKKSGLELIIQTLPEIRKTIPDIKLLVIGDGPQIENYKKLAQNLGVKDAVEFKGFVSSNSEIGKMISYCSIGIAPYMPEINGEKSYSYFSDPGKPKVYMACGLPVVIVRVPLIADEIEKAQAGYAISYDKKQMANAVLNLLNNDSLYQRYRNNAYRLGGTFDWGEIFSRALGGIFDSEKL